MNLSSHSARRSAAVGAAVLLASVLAADADTLRLLPAKDLKRFRVSLNQGNDRTDPTGVFGLSKEGVLQVSGVKKGFLVTEQTFRDYTLVAEYRWKTSSPNRDSGIFVNTVETHGRFTALECDIPKPAAGLSGRLWLFGRGTKAITVAGREISRGGVAPQQGRSVEKPIGEWNLLEVSCRGNAFQIKLNGEVTVDGTNPVPRSGAIMLQSSTGAIEFRRLEVTTTGDD